MTKLKTLGSGEKIQAPAVAKMLIEDLVVGEANKLETAKITGTHQDRMSYPCGVCRGSGVDPEDKIPCLACEGSGKDYELVYGTDDGQAYAYVMQYGMDFFKEYCKACREAEAEMSLRQRADRFMVRAYSLPAVIEMELQARGFTPQDIRGGGERSKEVAKVVQTEFPDLMTTNYRF